MTYIQCTPSQPQLIAVTKLSKSELNARRTNKPDGIGGLKASILSHGLMQNLVVTDSQDGNYRVIAGGRRLQAIHELQAEGKLPPDFAVPCQIVTEEYALEMSLAENAVRLAMHPADQFEIFSDLIHQGANACDIAQRFGIEESLVHKRMKLARVAPELLQEYRNDGMMLECLMAFTITDDHRRQRKVFKSLQGWQKDDPSVIRDALTEKMVDASSKLAQFVGLESYEAAGGSRISDLFSEEVYLENPALLNTLAAKKLDDIREQLDAEGWGWVEINPERDWNLINRCSRIQPRIVGAPADLLSLKTQLDAELEEVEESLADDDSDELEERQQSIRDHLDEVEERLAAFVGYKPQQMALAGCFVSIGQDGMPFLDKGLVKPEHRKQLATLLGGDDGTPPNISTKPKGELSETLRRDLANERLQIAQVEIARHPQIALDLLIFQAASSLLKMPSRGDGADVHFKRPPVKQSAASEGSSNDALESIGTSLSADWLKPKTEAERFHAFCSLSQTDKLDLLGYCVALTLKPKLAPTGNNEATAYDVALSMTDADVSQYWRPTKDNFLVRLNRIQLLGICREVLGEGWAQASSTHKKALLVGQLDRAFSDPVKAGRNPEETHRLQSWLPAGMAFTLPEAAKPEKAKKARKAA